MCFLPLQNVTSQYQQIIESAAAVDLSKILPAGADHTLLRGYKAQQDVILSLYASPEATVQETAFGGGATVPVVLLKPLSRGSILINSTDPLADPVFDYGTFNHPADIAVAVASIKRNRDCFTSGPMKEVGAMETVPGPQISSYQALEDAIRGLATSTWSHPVGTLAMMKRKYGGVVDPQLRVYGIKGLRVVDASVFPIIPASHTSSTAYAVAEKVSSYIAFRIPRFTIAWQMLTPQFLRRRISSKRRKNNPSEQSCYGQLLVNESFFDVYISRGDDGPKRNKREYGTCIPFLLKKQGF